MKCPICKNEEMAITGTCIEDCIDAYLFCPRCETKFDIIDLITSLQIKLDEFKNKWLATDREKILELATELGKRFIQQNKYMYVICNHSDIQKIQTSDIAFDISKTKSSFRIFGENSIYDSLADWDKRHIFFNEAEAKKQLETLKKEDVDAKQKNFEFNKKWRTIRG